MTPKEKADELMDKFKKYAKDTEPKYDDWTTPELAWKMSKVNQKQCALIAVDEILKAPFIHSQYVGEIPEDSPDTSWYWDEFNKFWEQVKQEIEGL